MGKEEIKKIKQAALEPKKKKYYQIPRASAKKLARAESDKLLLEADKEFYLEVWREVPHVCQCGCGKRLGNIINFFFFHHLLEKETDRYAHLRHVKKNIMILSTDCHYSYHSSPDSRPEVQCRRIEAEKLLIK